jgi:CBS domain-containing protein
MGGRKNDGFSAGEATAVMREPQKAKDIMKYGVITVRKDASIYEAIGILIEKDISGLPVVDQTGQVGIISEKDVLRLLYEKESVSGTVGEFMTSTVVSFEPEDSLSDICECFVQNAFRRVTILEAGRLVGVVTRADMIRANKYKFRREGSAADFSGRENFLARDVMRYGLFTVRPETTIYEAMDILASKNITGLPVVDDCMNLVGIVSEKDILGLLYGVETRPQTVGEIMTEEVVSFNHNDSLFDVCDCLINNDFRRVPILDRGKLVGIITRTDIIEYILRNQAGVFKQRRARR